MAHRRGLNPSPPSEASGAARRAGGCQCSCSIAKGAAVHASAAAWTLTGWPVVDLLALVGAVAGQKARHSAAIAIVAVAAAAAVVDLDRTVREREVAASDAVSSRSIAIPSGRGLDGTMAQIAETPMPCGTPGSTPHSHFEAGVRLGSGTRAQATGALSGPARSSRRSHWRAALRCPAPEGYAGDLGCHIVGLGVAPAERLSALRRPNSVGTAREGGRSLSAVTRAREVEQA